MAKAINLTPPIFRSKNQAIIICFKIKERQWKQVINPLVTMVAYIDLQKVHMVITFGTSNKGIYGSKKVKLTGPEAINDAFPEISLS